MQYCTSSQKALPHLPCNVLGHVIWLSQVAVASPALLRDRPNVALAELLDLSRRKLPKLLGHPEAEQVPLDLDPAANDILERLPEHRELVPERVRARAPKPLVSDDNDGRGVAWRQARGLEACKW